LESLSFSRASEAEAQNPAASRTRGVQWGKTKTIVRRCGCGVGRYVFVRCRFIVLKPLGSAYPQGAQAAATPPAGRRRLPSFSRNVSQGDGDCRRFRAMSRRKTDEYSRLNSSRPAGRQVNIHDFCWGSNISLSLVVEEC
ncbi:MAG: hypothetical protein Q4E17_04690, partial [Synergistes sp.]|nr:hypothetical protein [Synergistes sp.]